jgi:hypothetical protein
MRPSLKWSGKKGIELHVNSRRVHEEYPVAMGLLEKWRREGVRNDNRKK